MNFNNKSEENKKMKIAIITFSDFNTNYGSMLQSFALNYYLTNLGHQVSFIRYREFNDSSPNVSIKKCIINYIKRFCLKLYSTLKMKDIKRTISNFEDFKKFLNYTELYTSNEDLKEISDKFDCYICGSDQIWNLECLGGLRKAYFLDFAENSKIKIAYAASTGDYKFTDEEIKEISLMLNNIDHISIREKETSEWMNEIFDKDIINVVDPTFLMSKSEWQECIPKKLIEKDYAVCYFVRRSKFGKKIVKELSKMYDIPIYNLSDNNIYINGTCSDFISVGPLEFLCLINEARYTIGTSFHLAVFSIIFEKPFIIIGMSHNRNRINNILKLASLEENYLTIHDNIHEKLSNLFNQKPNKQFLYDQIEISKKFLDKSLKKNKVE